MIDRRLPPALSGIKDSAVPQPKLRGALEVVMAHRLNIRIAGRLRQMSELLEHQGETGFRAQAYRHAADIVERLGRPADEILASEGREGLVALPAIGRSIASAIAEMITTGRWSALDRLTGELDPEALLMTVPGIGPQLAQRLHTDLHIDSLEELEQAANTGRLDRLAGFGERRLEAIRAALRDRLQVLRGRVRRGNIPSVKLLLQVDAAYRDRASRNELKLIAPRRFNPKGIAWLPVMHTQYRGWYFTAMYSNTARAHQLNKSRDWVIIFTASNLEPDWQCTVVTETHGALKGRRVVRGQETACERHYERETASQPA